MNKNLTKINMIFLGFVGVAAFVGLVSGYLGYEEYAGYDGQPTFSHHGQASGSAKPQRLVSATDSSTSPVEVTFLHKQFQVSNYEAGNADAILMSLALKNVTDKKIKSVDGALIFTDQLNNQVMSLNLALSEPIDSGSLRKWRGGVNFNPFSDQDQRLRRASSEDLKLIFIPHKVLFSDGTERVYD